MRTHDFPPTAAALPTTYVLDLRGTEPTPGVLREYLVPLAQAMRGGLYGRAKLVVCTQDDAIAEVIALLAHHHHLALYIAPAPDRLAEAQPAGVLTPTDQQTLAALVRAGGRVSAAQLARAATLELTAASNRLSNLEKKGYVYRLTRPGRDGDLYADPRVPDPQRALESILRGMTQVMPPDAYVEAEKRMRQGLESEPEEDSARVY